MDRGKRAIDEASEEREGIMDKSHPSFFILYPSIYPSMFLLYISMLLSQELKFLDLLII
jgi:hypothetical protein